MNLYHLGLDVNSCDPNKPTSQSESITRLLTSNPNITSLNLVDSRVTKVAMTNIQTALENDKLHLINVNLQYAYLTLE